MKKIFSIAVVVALFVFMSGSVIAANYSYYSQGVQRGLIKGAYPTYTNDTYVKIKTGYGECNGHYWEITSDIDLEIDSGSPTGEDFYYIYVNDSNDDYPTLDNTSLYDSTTEPAWSDTKQGWYNSNDRCIGAVYINSSNTIKEYTIVNENEFLFKDANIWLENDTSPTDNNWYATSTDADTVTPVIANALWIDIESYDADGDAGGKVRPVSNTNAFIGANEPTWFRQQNWAYTGTEDRSVQYSSNAGDNWVRVQLRGYRVER